MVDVQCTPPQINPYAQLYAMCSDRLVILKRSAITTLVMVLAACASSNQSKIETAATTPLNDLNLTQNRIPEVLLIAQKAAYAIPDDTSCAVLSDQIAWLDEALGPDLDAPATDANPGLIERGGTVANDTAMGALQSTAEGIIPFRGWVRKITGAERHSRKVAAAISAGIIRSAFLKGIRTTRACP
jgi:hypothetical protein